MPASAGAEWSYSGPTGPAHWGSLDPAYAACSDGRAQSPVNLRQVTRKPLRNPRFHYVAGRATVVNNTDTVVAEARPGSTMTLGGTTYKLLQIHFHVHSEHEVNRPKSVGLGGRPGRQVVDLHLLGVNDGT